MRIWGGAPSVLRRSNNNMLIGVDIEPLSDEEKAKVDKIFAASDG